MKTLNIQNLESLVIIAANADKVTIQGRRTIARRAQAAAEELALLRRLVKTINAVTK